MMDDVMNNAVDVQGRVLQLMKTFENQPTIIETRPRTNKGLKPLPAPRVKHNRDTPTDKESRKSLDLDLRSSSDINQLTPVHSKPKALLSPTTKKRIIDFYGNSSQPFQPACLRQKSTDKKNPQQSRDSSSSAPNISSTVRKKKLGSRRSSLLPSSLSLSLVLCSENDASIDIDLRDIDVTDSTGTPDTLRHSTGSIVEQKSPIETCFVDKIENFNEPTCVSDELSSCGDSDDSWFDFNDDDDDDIYANLITSISITQEEDEPSVSIWQRVVQEFVSTEKSYVQKLKLISEDFLNELLELNQKEPMIPETVPLQIFSNIQTIYEFHKDHLLPQLEQCAVISADRQPVKFVGAVFKKLAPFLKMYSVYVRNFDNARKIFARWRHKSPRFLVFIREFETRLKCGQLEIQYHMLEPIQRIPRYKLLLQEYLKHMPEDSSDSADAKEALESITVAANQINQVRKLAEATSKLLKIQKMLLDAAVDVVGPGRELVKEGKVSVSSTKSKDDEDRYLFLFNDMLLVCKEISQGLKPKYKVSVKISMHQMKVKENSSTPEVLTISATEGIVELKFGTLSEKNDWSAELEKVLQQWKSVQLTHQASQEILADEHKRPGRRAPVFVNFQDTSICMSCGDEFGLLTRPHHCHCCGVVVCGNCCTHTAVLKYNGLEKRVCLLCFTKLQIEHSKLGTTVTNHELTNSYSVNQT